MEKLNIENLINLFLNNSEILLRSTTRKRDELSCTGGARNISTICKSLYSTRCENTTSSFNLFFQNDVYFYEDPFRVLIGKDTDVDLMLKIKKNIKYKEDEYINIYLSLLNEFCNYILNKNEDALYTFSFGGPSIFLFDDNDNLVGHVFNILRVKTNEGIFKNYIIQGYIYKYSPICIEINDEILKDYIRIFHAIRTYSSYIVDKFDNYDDYLKPGYILENQIIYTMFYENLQENKKMINPWFNEKFNQLFKAYYYDPFKNNLNDKQLGTSKNETRHYNFVSISISKVNEIPIIYYNMLSFLYVYYRIISYDIYSFKLIEILLNNDRKQYKYPIQYKYFIDNFNKKIFKDEDDINKYKYQYNNPTKYIDNNHNTDSSYMISFWENNMFIRLSYILSDLHIILSDTVNNTKQNSIFLFDLYSTLLYSAKTSILNFNGYIEKVNCNDPSIINDTKMKEIFNDNIICKYIIKNFHISEVSNFLQKIYLPHNLLINSLDIYDYYSNDSCKIYDILTNILVEIQDLFDTSTKAYIDSIFSNKMYNLLNAININNFIENGKNDKIKKLYYTIYRLFDENFNWITEQGVEYRYDGTSVNGYDPYKLTSLSNIIIEAIGFYLIERVSNTLVNFYNLEKNLDINTDNIYCYFSYDDCIKMFYSSDNNTINNSIIIVFNFFKPLIDKYYSKVNLEPIIKSYGIYISVIKNILLKNSNFKESYVINKVKNNML